MNYSSLTEAQKRQVIQTELNDVNAFVPELRIDGDTIEQALINLNPIIDLNKNQVAGSTNQVRFFYAICPD